MDGLVLGSSVRYVPPAVGRWKLEIGPLTASVAGIDDAARGVVTLTVLRRHGGPVTVKGVAFDASGQPGTWHWA